MANRSNKDLTTDILAVASELGKTVETNGLNNDALATLLESLQAEKAGKDATPAPPVPPAPPSGSAAEKNLKEAQERAAEVAAANIAREEASKIDPSKAQYVVAAGKSISCLRGIVDENQPLLEQDFLRGKADLDDLIGRGAVIKRA
jgi:hypothetical protein